MSEEQDKKVCEGEGTIEKKEEAVTKKGDKYWKFTIDGKTFSLFEHPAGHDVSVGDHVGMFWTETKGNYKGKDVTYRNLNSIFKKDAVPMEEVKDSAAPQKNMGAVEDYKVKEADKYYLGMAINNTGLVMRSMLAKASSLDEAKEMMKNEAEYFDKVTVALYNRYKLIRQQILGY